MAQYSICLAYMGPSTQFLQLLQNRGVHRIKNSTLDPNIFSLYTEATTVFNLSMYSIYDYINVSLLLVLQISHRFNHTP